MSVSTLPTAMTLWENLLDELERDLERAEALVTVTPTAADAAEAQPSAWTPPAPAVPIPASLVPRAELLLQRQQQVAALVTDRLGSHRSQLRVTDRFAQATSRVSVAAYVDTTA